MDNILFFDPQVRYEELGLGDVNISRNTVSRMRDIIRQSSANEYVRKWAEHIVMDVKDRDRQAEVYVIFKWIQDHTRYANDPLGTEYIQTPPYILKQIEAGLRPSADCFANDEKIIVLHKTKKLYSLQEVGRLGENNYRNYDALSFDWETNQFVFNPITRWVDKGKKEVFLVKLKNGNSFRVTLDHDIICMVDYKTGKFNSRSGDYVQQKVTLGELRKRFGETGEWPFLPIARQIPIMDTQPGKSLDELWLEGLFVGDGCSSSGTCTIAADTKNIQHEVKRILKEKKLLWKIYTEENSKHTGGDYFKIERGLYSQYLVDNFGGRADTKQFPIEYLSLNLIQTKKLLEGYDAADGCTVTKGGWLGKLKTMYTTTSDILAEQLVFLHMLIDRPLWVGYQDINHLRTLNIKKLYSKKSSWRLYDRIFTGRSRYSGGGGKIMGGLLTMSRIKSVESVGIKPVCDLTVKDTHNVVMRHGLIIGQCDDMTVLGLSLLRSLGYRSTIRAVGFGKSPKQKYSHVYGMVMISPKDGWTAFDCVRKDQTLGWQAPGIKAIMDLPV